MRRREVLLCTALCASLLSLAFVAESKRPPFWSRAATGDLHQARQAAEKQRDEAVRRAEAAVERFAALAASEAELRDQVRRLDVSVEDWRRRALAVREPPAVLIQQPPVQAPQAKPPAQKPVVRKPVVRDPVVLRPVAEPAVPPKPKDTSTSVQKLLNGELTLAEINEIAAKDKAKGDRLRQMYWEIDRALTPTERDHFHHRRQPLPNLWTMPRPENPPLNLSGSRTWEKAYRAVHSQKTSTVKVGGNPARP